MFAKFKKRTRSVQLEPRSGSMFLAVGETHGKRKTKKETSSNTLFLLSSSEGERKRYCNDQGRSAIANQQGRASRLKKSVFKKTKKMGKKLSEMTLEELWELFPIYLVQHDDKWTDSYMEIEATITNLLANYHVERISHIGSTAIHGIWAKNIVDVLIEISENADIEEAAYTLERNGFIRMSADMKRISLNKGYTKEGFADKVYHIHLRYAGDNDELYFRDYLNDHPDVAKEYEALKLKLWKKYEHNRDAYTEAKTDFIHRWTQEARKEYGNRYC